MENTLTHIPESKKSQKQLPFKIIPLSDRARISPKLQLHAQDMCSLVDHLLTSRQITYSPNPSFLSELESALPIIHLEIAKEAPGDVILSCLCKNSKTHDLSHFFREMVERWLIPWGRAEIVSTRQISFCFSDHPKKALFLMEIVIQVEDDAALLSIREKNNPFIEELALGAVSPYHARHILATKGLTQEQKTTQINKVIVSLSNEKLKSLASELFFELHHFLLACDDEFRRIRQVSHLCRTVVYLAWFKKQLATKAKFLEKSQREIIFKVKKSSLQFTFGQKWVLGITIAMSHLNEYEQFEDKHILKACQKLIPHCRQVPHSFFHYKTPSDAVHSFYLEIEKKDGKDFTSTEIKTLREGLKSALFISIEQLSHKLFMPHNEEEVLRNILVLSNELRGPQDIPQIIITWRGQSETSLTFHVTLVRLISEGAEKGLEALFETSPELISFLNSSKKIVGQLKSKQLKEANTFLLECPKTPFLRQDHSVDLLRAREFIVSSLKKLIGQVRDFNGGMIGQQNQLFTSLKELLTQEELKHELHLENLFHSITPVLMKSLLSPELIKELFHLFIELLEETEVEGPDVRYKFHRLEHAICFMISSDDKTLFDSLEKSLHQLNLGELEYGVSTFRVSNCFYQGYIVVPQDQETIDRFTTLMVAKLSSLEKSKNLGQTLKISLPRPAALLDPRVGTDRTSGIVIKMLYEGLLRIDSTGKPSPAIAENYEISPDQKSYTFFLRKTLWSNGKPVTAYDFEYAWKKQLDPDFKSLYTYLFYAIKNAKEAKKGQKSLEEVGIYVKDAYTLHVVLEYPAPYFLELCAHWVFSPLSKEVDELHPGWAYYGGEHFVCNGPFRLAKWKRNTEIQAIKNSHYWDAEFVHLRKIDISVVEDPQQALLLYQKGELDWIGEPLSELPPETFKKKIFSGRIQSHLIDAVHWYSCNVKVAPFQSKKCRLALACAINRQNLIDDILHGGEQPAYTILPPTLSLLKEAPFHDGDLEKAKKLFHEGLKEQKLTLAQIPPLTITCFDNKLHEAVAHHIAGLWSELFGLTIRIETYKWDVFMQKCLQYDFHIMSQTWYSWYHDPIYNLNVLKYENGDMNTSQWSNKDFTELLQKANYAIDPKERKNYLRQAEMIAMEEMPMIPLFYHTFKYMKKEHVNNIVISHLGQIDLKLAYLNKK